MKYISSSIFAALFALMACNKSDVTQEIQNKSPRNYKTLLFGFKAYPPNSSPASGVFTGTLNTDTHEFSYLLEYSDMTEPPTSWHIHRAPAGEAGPIIISLGPIVPSPLTGTVNLTEAQMNELMNNEYYVDVHSNAFEEGEIRGQLGKNTGK